jgi:hypothetical protein
MYADRKRRERLILQRFYSKFIQNFAFWLVEFYLVVLIFWKAFPFFSFFPIQFIVFSALPPSQA